MLTRKTRRPSRWLALDLVVGAVIVALLSCNNSAPPKAPATQLEQQRFEYPQTHELVSLVLRESWRGARRYASPKPVDAELVVPPKPTIH